MENIFIGFCVTKFIDFNKFLNYVDLKGGKCVYIFESGKLDDQKQKLLYKLGKKVNIYKDSSSIESKLNPQGKIDEIHLYLNQLKSIKTIIKYTDTTQFVFYLDQCDTKEYKDMLNIFNEVNNIIVIGRSLLEITKELIASTTTCDELLKYAKLCEKYKCISLKDYYIWEPTIIQSNSIDSNIDSNIDSTIDSTIDSNIDDLISQDFKLY